ncbi:MAG: class I SAM-dependent methyltransferase [Conexivisphaerales archaeon]|jgi:predicted O-methyltransferase YrrM
MAVVPRGSDPLLEEARELAGRTEGWLSEAEGEALFALARGCRPPGVIVEIGSWKGKSTTWLAKGSRSGPGLKVCAIDPHRGGSADTGELVAQGTFQDFAANMKRAGIDDLVVPYVMTSAEAATQVQDGVALVFIDGSHEYEDVKLDVELWSPKVVDGGHLALHDAVNSVWPGVPRAVREVVYESSRFRSLRLVDSMSICEKADGNGLSQRFQRRWALLIFDVSNLVVRHHPPRPLLSLGQRIVRRLH